MDASHKTTGRIIVTDADSPVGQSVVERLASAGAGTVYAAARDPFAVVEASRRSGGRVLPLWLDSRSDRQIADALTVTGGVNLVIETGGWDGRDERAARLRPLLLDGAVVVHIDAAAPREESDRVLDSAVRFAAGG